MIGVSLPEECFRPFSEVIVEMRRDFPLWEVVSELEHDVSQCWKEMKAAREPVLQVHAPFSDLNIGALGDKARDYALRVTQDTIHKSALAGVKMITLHPGIVSPMGSYNRSKVLARTIESLGKLREFAEDEGTTVCVENMPKGGWALMWRADESRRVCEETGLGLCFDIGHANVSGQVAEFLALRDLYVNVHVHDNKGGHDEHLTIGDGTADFAGLKKALAGYNGNVVIEARSLASAVESKKRLESMGCASTY
jgi:sugar phosphate isomerase/epimerase